MFCILRLDNTNAKWSWFFFQFQVYFKSEQDRLYTHNVTFGCVRLTIVTVEKTVLYIFVCVCVCVWVGGCTGAGIYFRACSITNPACNAPPYCHLRPVWLRHMFRHYLINGTIFEKNLLNMECVFWFSLQLVFKIFSILTIIQRDIIINVKTSSCKVSVFLIRL